MEDGCRGSVVVLELLLSSPRHISGVVTDADGKPVADVHIDQTDDHFQGHQTDGDGKFELDTRAPAIVLRKAGYRSEFVRTKTVTKLYLTLEKITDKRTFPACPAGGQYDGIEGFGALFEFPKTAGVMASPQDREVDNATRYYNVRTKQGPRGVIHGSGPLWSFGLPADRDVWRSSEYDEISYDAGGQVIRDARGVLMDGTRWRNLGKFGESASYTDVDEATARILDQLLDSACLKPVAR